jgi:hypothetical protein
MSRGRRHTNPPEVRAADDEYRNQHAPGAGAGKSVTS